MRDFNHTVNVLVKAYLKGTLEHGNCFACAVGNLVTDANNCTFTRGRGFGLTWKNGHPHWLDGVKFGQIKDSDNLEAAKKQAESTGYTLEEIAKIECAFEYGYPVDFSSPSPKSYDGYLGLMRVVDVLADIHGISLEQKSEAKAMFVKENPIEP